MKRLINKFILKFLVKPNAEPESLEAADTTFGVSTDDDAQFSTLPTILPEVGTRHKIAPDLKGFSVVHVDKEKSLITLVEDGSNEPFDLEVEAFDLLFMGELIRP